MVIADRPDLHVLLGRRSDEVVFGAAHWVFPGGRVDPSDHSGAYGQICQGLSDSDASLTLGIQSHGLAWWLAACRETLEEAGILFASPTPSPQAVQVFRASLAAGEIEFASELARLGLSIDAGAIKEVARFITPLGPPRRFDARFFLTQAQANSEASSDDSEIVEWRWSRPSEALAQWQAGQFKMMSPTVRMVESLSQYKSSNEAMAVANLKREYRRIRILDPDGQYRVVLPGEHGYESAEERVESGWVRLWGESP